MSNFTVEPNLDLLNKFNIYRKPAPNEDIYVKGIPYIFFTTPKLNFSQENINRDNYLLQMSSEYPKLLKCLTTDPFGNDSMVHPFIKIFSNCFIDIDGKDLAARSENVGDTFYGYHQTLPISIVDSIIDDTVTVKFNEYKYLPITRITKAWIEYTERVRRGIFAPKLETIKQRFIDYVSSIYYFVTDFDGQTILYFSKYTGIVPISNPYSSLVTGSADHNISETSIEFLYSYKEDLNPAILSDFNKVSLLDNDGLKYSIQAPNKGYIPNSGEQLMPDNFTEESFQASKVLIVREKTNYNSYLSPDTKYVLKFLN